MQDFDFTEGSIDRPGHSVPIPTGVEHRYDIFDPIAKHLKFPSYFGWNWDALFECLCDLDWLPPGNIHIEHGDMPFSCDPQTLGTYLSVLDQAQEHWRGDGTRAMTVTFPAATRGDIARTWAECENQ